MIDKKYNILCTIGTGGSSNILKAEDFAGRFYAIKTIRKDKKYDAKFEASLLSKEFCILNSLSPHPNIITTHDISLLGLYESSDFSGTWMYAALEYAENGALSTFIKETGPLEEEIVRFYAYQIVHAVKHIHDCGFAHLDLKLENLLLDEFFNAKVADFGWAVNVKETWGFTGHKRGTYIYMPPEIADLSEGEEYDAYAADMYSLGVTLFIMLTGKIPKKKASVGKTLSFDSNKSIQTIASEADDESNSIWRSDISEDIKFIIESLTDSADEMRLTPEEMFKDSWLAKPFSSSIKDIVFKEMSTRKKFMQTKNDFAFEDNMMVD
jgi:serine/threonine protein kinase